MKVCRAGMKVCRAGMNLPCGDLASFMEDPWAASGGTREATALTRGGGVSVGPPEMNHSREL